MVVVRRQLGRLAKLKHQTQAWLDQHRAMRRWLHVLRLGLFQFGMGLSLAPLTGRRPCKPLPAGRGSSVTRAAEPEVP